MGPIRVMLGEMPEMLHDILEETLAGQDDVILVGNRDGALSLRSAVDLEVPDVVVVGVDREEWVGGFAEIFREHPLLRLLAIRNDGRGAVMQRPSIPRYCVPDLSPSAILAAIRASCTAPDGDTDAPFHRERP